MYTASDAQGSTDGLVESDSFDLHSLENHIDISASAKQPADPASLAAHRKANWPHPSPQFPSELARIYSAVRDTGLPNCIGARITVPSQLNLPAWRKYLPDNEDGNELYTMLCCGFPSGYQGPVSAQTHVDNHPSARFFDKHVSDYINAEVEYGALIGPFEVPPFAWVHSSPMMTRPKNGTDKRRVISDLSYGHSVNEHIVKGNVLGRIRPHRLPTIDEVTEYINRHGPDVHIAAIDLQRAYRQFPADPLDWVLASVVWNGRYYIDLRMPFGQRISSLHMQRIADAIVAILKSWGYTAIIYLDDIILLGRNKEETEAAFKAALELLCELGLPVSERKLQPPSQCATWLGVDVDVPARELRITKQKIDDTLEVVDKLLGQRSLTRKQLRSVLGKLHHVSKTVRPGRLFVARLLEALRAMGNGRRFTTISASMRKDLRWFSNFLVQYNGRSMMPQPEPTHVIEADACPGGIGACSLNRYYSAVVPSELAGQPIAKIEAANVGLAAKTFFGDMKPGDVGLLCSDNQPTVEVLQHGRGRDPDLLAVARDIWWLQATLDIVIIPIHVPGEQLVLADALSRRLFSRSHRRTADEIIAAYNMTPVYIDPYMLMSHTNV